MAERPGGHTNIAVLGAGLIGQRHALIVTALAEVNLTALVDPSPQATTLGEDLSCPVFGNLEALFDSGVPVDGVIVATPNNTHLELSLACIERGIPLLVEKPLAVDSTEAARIADASKASAVPVLVGHHRHYHAASQDTRELLQSGRLGQLVGGQVTWCLRKPDDYFEHGAWRKTAGGGPVWINLISEIDLLRYFYGEVLEVTAMTSNATRGAEIEDTAALVLRSENGALVNVPISDTAPSPWHFEGASGENPNIAATGHDEMRIVGTRGALGFPSLTLWQHDDDETGNWGDPIHNIKLEASRKTDGGMGGEIALTQQIEHFCRVIRGAEKPMVSSQDGLRNIRVTEAILASAQEGRVIRMCDADGLNEGLAGEKRLAG